MQRRAKTEAYLGQQVLRQGGPDSAGPLPSRHERPHKIVNPRELGVNRLVGRRSNPTGSPYMLSNIVQFASLFVAKGGSHP
jgi:hypothetical protein